MKPAPFDYVAASDLDEAVALLAEYGDDAKALAGGQSLVPMMNFRLARPSVLVDLNRMEALSYIREDEDGLRIGALTRHHAVATSDLVRRRCPLLAHAAGHIGYPAIRRRGTIGGSLAHADPVAEMACIAVTLDADVVVQGPRGRRTIPASEFFVSVFTTALEPDEILAEVRISCPEREQRQWGFQQFARKRGDFAMVMCAVAIDHDGEATRRARIGVAGVSEVAVRASAGERALEGNPLDDEVLTSASEASAASVDPRSDVHATAAFRRHLVKVLTSRAIQDARDRSGW
jgi:carbon-monoxide dehydrogenase medium subunit